MTPENPTPPSTPTSRKLLGAAILILGIAFLVAAAYIGYQTDVALRLQRDLTWERAPGTALTSPRYEGYLISYRHPNGTLWADNQKGWIGFWRGMDDNFPINVAYNRVKPYELQPAGVSYGLSALVAALIIMGITFVLGGMRRMSATGVPAAVAKPVEKAPDEQSAPSETPSGRSTVK